MMVGKVQRMGEDQGEVILAERTSSLDLPVVHNRNVSACHRHMDAVLFSGFLKEYVCVCVCVAKTYTDIRKFRSEVQVHGNLCRTVLF